KSQHAMQQVQTNAASQAEAATQNVLQLEITTQEAPQTRFEQEEKQLAATVAELFEEYRSEYENVQSDDASRKEFAEILVSFKDLFHKKQDARFEKLAWMPKELLRNFSGNWFTTMEQILVDTLCGTD